MNVYAYKFIIFYILHYLQCLNYILIYKTVLHYACQSGNLELVQYLLSLGRLENIKYAKDIMMFFYEWNLWIEIFLWYLINIFIIFNN